MIWKQTAINSPCLWTESYSSLQFVSEFYSCLFAYKTIIITGSMETVYTLTKRLSLNVREIYVRNTVYTKRQGSWRACDSVQEKDNTNGS